MLGQYPEKVKLVYKHFPIQSHRYAVAAATASMAAHRQGKFWAFHDRLFAIYNTMDDQKIRDIARALSLDEKQFDADMKDPGIQAKIRNDQKEGVTSGVRGTPAVFINGRELKDRSLRGFRTMIDAALERME